MIQIQTPRSMIVVGTLSIDHMFAILCCVTPPLHPLCCTDVPAVFPLHDNLIGMRLSCGLWVYSLLATGWRLSSWLWGSSLELVWLCGWSDIWKSKRFCWWRASRSPSPFHDYPELIMTSCGKTRVWHIHSPPLTMLSFDLSESLAIALCRHYSKNEQQTTTLIRCPSVVRGSLALFSQFLRRRISLLLTLHQGMNSVHESIGCLLPITDRLVKLLHILFIDFLLSYNTYASLPMAIFRWRAW